MAKVTTAMMTITKIITSMRMTTKKMAKSNTSTNSQNGKRMIIGTLVMIFTKHARTPRNRSNMAQTRSARTPIHKIHSSSHTIPNALAPSHVRVSLAPQYRAPAHALLTTQVPIAVTGRLPVQTQTYMYQHMSPSHNGQPSVTETALTYTSGTNQQIIY